MTTAKLVVIWYSTLFISGILFFQSHWDSPWYSVAAVVVLACTILYTLQHHPNARKRWVLFWVSFPFIAAGLSIAAWYGYEAYIEWYPTQLIPHEHVGLSNLTPDQTQGGVQGSIPVPTSVEEKPFVGLAISGGGSRSANFAAAVMEELDRYGFLAHVNALSAVSGGTLPAAYYALNRNKPDWSWANLRRLVGSNFYFKFLWKHFNPWGFLNYSFRTNYNRSDMMADVFDDVLFHGAMFTDLESGNPQLIINATTLYGEHWKSNEYMHMHMKISNAVAASTAVPGIFNGIAIKTPTNNEKMPYEYIHLMDGGVIENLGLETLLQLYSNTLSMDHLKSKDKPTPACFIFLIDSFPDLSSRLESRRMSQQRDLRHGTDFIIDRNLLHAIDIFSAKARDRFIKSLGTRVEKIEWPIYDVSYDDDSKVVHCTIWHFNFRLLYHVPFNREKVGPSVWNAELSRILPMVETHWKIVAPGNCSQKALQAALYDGAQILVRQDRITMEVKTWLQEHGLQLQPSSPEQGEEPAYDFHRNHGGRLDVDEGGALRRVTCSE